MRIAFVDTGYWLALINADDDLRTKAMALADRVVGWRLITTDWVLVEVLNALSRRGVGMRRARADAVRQIMAAPQIEVVRLPPKSFAAALVLYESRADKAWSLTDCASIELMHERRISGALAHDRHFEQARFRALLR